MVVAAGEDEPPRPPPGPDGIDVDDAESTVGSASAASASSSSSPAPGGAGSSPSSSASGRKKSVSLADMEDMEERRLAILESEEGRAAIDPDAEARRMRAMAKLPTRNIRGNVQAVEGGGSISIDAADF